MAINANERDLDEAPTSASGLLHSLSNFVGTLLGVAHTRLQLLTTELQEEVQRAAHLLVWAFVALFAAMLALFTFVATWTNFFWPFIILDSSNPTLPVALSLLQSNFFIDYSIVLAGVLLSTIPLLILFVVAGKQLVSGIMQGAVKG